MGGKKGALLDLPIPYNFQTKERMKSLGVSQRRMVDLMVEYGVCSEEQVGSMRSRVSAALTGKRGSVAYVRLLDEINITLDKYLTSIREAPVNIEE